jgi:hypothetical protein
VGERERNFFCVELKRERYLLNDFAARQIFKSLSHSLTLYFISFLFWEKNEKQKKRNLVVVIAAETFLFFFFVRKKRAQNDSRYLVNFSCEIRQRHHDDSSCNTSCALLCLTGNLWLLLICEDHENAFFKWNGINGHNWMRKKIYELDGFIRAHLIYFLFSCFTFETFLCKRGRILFAVNRHALSLSFSKLTVIIILKLINW